MSDLSQKLLQGFVDSPPITPEEAVEFVRIAEFAESYRQVGKALFGKENAALEEVLQAVSQVKAELAAVKRERDAALADMKRYTNCQACKHWEESMAGKCTMKDDCLFGTIGKFEWRGVCPENTEVQEDDH